MMLGKSWYCFVDLVMAYTFTFDAEIVVPRTQNPELSRVLSCQPGAGQKMPKHACLLPGLQPFSCQPSWFIQLHFHTNLRIQTCILKKSRSCFFACDLVTCFLPDLTSMINRALLLEEEKNHIQSPLFTFLLFCFPARPDVTVMVEWA